MMSHRFILKIIPKSIQSGNRIGIGKGGKARFFSSAKKDNYVATVAALSSKFAPDEPSLGAIRLDLVFILPRPKNLMRKCDPDGLIYHTKRPDRDNLVKGTQDGLSSAGFWVDDAQICAGELSKFYAEKNGQPRIEVTIQEL